MSLEYLTLVTSGRHNSAIITDRRKFTTKITLYGISSFHFYHWNQFKVIPVACTQCTRNLPKFCVTSDVVLTTRQIMLTSLSHRQPITINY